MLVAVVQRCHRGEVVNAGWREAEVPSMDMAACLGCSGLRAHPVDGAAGMECQGRSSPEARSNRLGVGSGGAGGTSRAAASDRRLRHQHQRYPEAADVLADVNPDHWIVLWNDLLSGRITSGNDLCSSSGLKRLCVN